MPLIVQFPTSPALLRRLEQLALAAKGGGPAIGWVKNDFRIIIEADHQDKMERGVDRYGIARAPLAASTLANPKRGPNPNSLIPHGLASRFIQNFVTEWDGDYLVQRLVGIVDKRGRSFAQYHLTGATKPGTRWVLPKRDVGGITPKGWAQIVKRHSEYAAQVLKGSK